MNQKYLVSTFLFFSLTAGVSFADIEKSIQEEFVVENGGTLTLETNRGSIVVSTHKLNVIKVNTIIQAKTNSERKAENWMEDFDLSFSQNENELMIEGELNRNLGFFRWSNKLKIRYEIIVPESFNLHMETSGGSFNIKNVAGNVWLDTSGGSITLDGVVGDVQAHTSGGSILTEGVEGNLDISTSGGSLRLNNVQGNVQGKTSGGSIRAEVLEQITEGIDLHTSGGSITIAIPEDLKADIDASTSGGRVSIDLPVLVVGERSKRYLKTELNGGGIPVYLHTSGGNITIKKSS